MSKPFEAWHFLPSDGRLPYGDGRLRFGERIKVEPGQTLTIEGPLFLCERGLHWSRRAVYAFGHAHGPIVERVRVSGEIREGRGIGCSTERTCLWIADATTVLHEFVLWAAERALLAARAAGREPDPRSWAVLDAKRAWLQGEITDQQLKNAREKAAAVAVRAPEIRASAAWDAYGAAAEFIVDASARSAALRAADVGARDPTSQELERRLFALAPVTGSP